MVPPMSYSDLDSMLVMEKRDSHEMSTKLVSALVTLFGAILLFALGIWVRIDVILCVRLRRQGYPWKDCMHMATRPDDSWAGRGPPMRFPAYGSPPPPPPPRPRSGSTGKWRTHMRGWLRKSGRSHGSESSINMQPIQEVAGVRAPEPAHTREHAIVRGRDSQDIEQLPAYSDTRERLPDYEDT